ncbi:type II secretion system F family protein [Vibrio sp. S4M6]|uniref:type II secretion system F family protein n=1 Tax=Vibrio sinus TaxID=2946865 RepID=UPI002029D0E5|nr:type II secretion system F family protein [Vibrio sinus]MCL9781038.1 type II secretion system F family protein [Vibrio sinus]
MLRRYYWQALDSQGQTISGVTLSLSADEVRAIVRDNQLRMKDMHTGGLTIVDKKKHSILVKDITHFTRQLATLLLAGLPIVTSLKLISSQSNKAELRSLMFLLVAHLESGDSLTNTMKHYPEYFNPLYIATIQSGELSGHLEQALLNLASHRENIAKLQGKLWQALQYPCLMLTTIIAVSYIMLTLVIPEFDSLFRGMNASLPWLTREVIKLSDLVQSRGWLVIFIIGSLIGFLIFTIKRSDFAKQKIHQGLLSTPAIGHIVLKLALARACRTLATNYRSGIPVLTNLSLAAQVCGNPFIQQSLDRCHEKILQGQAIHLALREEAIFPELMLQMVMIGEQTGQLDNMLDKLADIYDSEANHSIQSFSKLVEPILILVLGIIVGVLVIAMYLPIFNLTRLLG